MKGILLSLTGVMLCAAALHSAAADTAIPFQRKTDKELHAAVTDIPEVIDMSHADPSTWHHLPPAAQGYYDFTLALEMELTTHFRGRSRPF
jgi:hypothetical protein